MEVWIAINPAVKVATRIRPVKMEGPCRRKFCLSQLLNRTLENLEPSICIAHDRAKGFYRP